MNNQIIKNSKIIAYFIFLYGLLVPLNYIIGNQILIAIITFCLILYLTLTNSIKLSFLVLSIIIITSFVTSLKIALSSNLNLIHIEIIPLINFISIGLAGLMISSIKYDSELVLKHCTNLAFVNFLVLFYIPFTQIYGEDVNYMRFGYAILPTVLFSLNNLIQKKSTVANYLIFVVSVVEMFIYGNRGSLFVLLLFITYKLYKSKSILKTSIIIVPIIMFLFNLIRNSSLEFLNDINSYSLTKYLNILNGSSFSSQSSGRDIAYIKGLQDLLSSPVFGNNFSIAFRSTGLQYYHNFLLDIGVNFGLIILIVIFIILLTLVIKLLKSNDQFLVILFFIVFGRLLISSSFWERPDFWLFIGLLHNKYFKKIKIH